MKAKNIILIFLLILFFGCGKGQKQPNNLLSENFDEFYKKFYSDSLFQMSRINFPLASDVVNSSSSDIVDSTVRVWNRENWVILRNTYFKENDSIANINGEIYKRKIVNNKTQVIESIYIENSGFFIKMNFSLQNGKWHLIDYIESFD